MSRLAARVAALEDRRRSITSSPITNAVLDLLTDAELDELWALFEPHHPCEIEDLPTIAQARIVELLNGAKARAVQSGNPATARAAG